MKTVVTEGQLSIDNMDVAPVKIGGGQEVLEDRIERSYRALRLAADMSNKYYGQKLLVCISGGKDSSVITHLAEECLGTDFECIHSHTTLDYPETVKFVEREFARLEEKGIKCMYRNRFPVKVTIWDLIRQKKMPPDRIRRYCCAQLKETGSANRFAVLGVRAAESNNRQGRDTFGIRGGTKQGGLFFA